MAENNLLSVLSYELEQVADFYDETAQTCTRRTTRSETL